jgi:hypothetical protein
MKPVEGSSVFLSLSSPSCMVMAYTPGLSVVVTHNGADVDTRPLSACEVLEDDGVHVPVRPGTRWPDFGGGVRVVLRSKRGVVVVDEMTSVLPVL